MIVPLICTIVGREEGSAFPVDIDDNKSVGHLKDEIKAKNEDIQVPARNLRLFLAKKTDGAWLKDSDPAAEQLSNGEMHPHIQQMIDGEQAIATRTIKRWLFEDNKMSQPSTSQIHVLVVVSLGSISLRVAEFDNDARYTDELTHYQQRGELIRRNCKDYCQPILSKIDALYALSDKFVLPFICVEGSFGMGKSQLAFALGGSRPWFYWPIVIEQSFQRLYGNFLSISKAFSDVTIMDDPMQKSEEDILSIMSDFYDKESLWAFGFILALLKYCCCKEQNQQGHMIRLQEKTSLHMEKCNREKVVAFRRRMKAEKKVLPFFVLDEMTPSMHRDGSGKNMAAFQRNIFRVCGLVLIVMGTDAKITNLIAQSGGSYDEEHEWMTVVSRFPPYLPIPFVDEGKESAWNYVQDKYPVLKSIVENSRGRFARYFADSTAHYAMENLASGIILSDLLNEAFGHVSLKTHQGNHFMKEQEGKDAQLMAISYTNVDSDGTSPPPHKKMKTELDMGTRYMHLHFANLVDEQTTEVVIIDGRLKVDGMPWIPSCCFPSINHGMLLYLAILGGKTYSGYYDRGQCIDYSTLGIFSEYLKGKGFMPKINRKSVKKDYELYESMVAHMIFCASRRNGVQGIPFDEFFAGLLSECQEEIRPVTMTIGNTEKAIVASDLLETYEDLVALSRSKIPFLAPPNAEWPPCILDTRAEGCNFGHLVHVSNAERCDIYVRNMEDNSKPPLFLCECKYRSKNVDFGTMEMIIAGRNKVWEKWAVVLLFCVELASFRKDWKRMEVGCVKVNCRSGRVDWVFQPAKEENRKQLVIVMETGLLTVGVRSKPCLSQSVASRISALRRETNRICSHTPACQLLSRHCCRLVLIAFPDNPKQSFLASFNCLMFFWIHRLYLTLSPLSTC
ncbi:hypothetical protein KXD40_000085 [Peronospora effusa]|nr:hypothetical protein KXD40_000085 [Peronospora effusa]